MLYYIIRYDFYIKNSIRMYEIKVILLSSITMLLSVFVRVRMDSSCYYYYCLTACLYGRIRYMWTFLTCLTRFDTGLIAFTS